MSRYRARFAFLTGAGLSVLLGAIACGSQDLTQEATRIPAAEVANVPPAVLTATAEAAAGGTPAAAPAAEGSPEAAQAPAGGAATAAAPAPAEGASPEAAQAPAAAPAASPAGGAAGESDQALVTKGEGLFSQFACVGCHSISGQTSVGPPLNGLYGKEVTLADGSTVTADDAYLEESILEPDAKIHEGYAPGIMSATIAGFEDQIREGDNLQALVEYIKSLE